MPPPDYSLQINHPRARQRIEVRGNTLTQVWETGKKSHENQVRLSSLRPDFSQQNPFRDLQRLLLGSLTALFIYLGVLNLEETPLPFWVFALISGSTLLLHRRQGAQSPRTIIHRKDGSGFVVIDHRGVLQEELDSFLETLKQDIQQRQDAISKSTA